MILNVVIGVGAICYGVYSSIDPHRAGRPTRSVGARFANAVPSAVPGAKWNRRFWADEDRVRRYVRVLGVWFIFIGVAILFESGS